MVAAFLRCGSSTLDDDVRDASDGTEDGPADRPADLPRSRVARRTGVGDPVDGKEGGRSRSSGDGVIGARTRG